ncbi:cytochrome c [Paenibacillus sp. PL2-23]|uniref:c-type cytochrome n=1 Tax=Paenibacillus sp. PL2-23 TaxID=2100729 RepID=UPI0030F64A9B
MKNRWIGAKGGIAFVLLAVLAGCGGSDSHQGSGNTLAAAPAEAASLYKTNCISCHGTDLEGRVGSKSNLQRVGSRLDSEQLKLRIEEGKGVMPAFKDRLTQEELETLAQWLSGQQ